MIASTTDMLRRALEGGYAVPAINTQGGNFDIIHAICDAAQEMNAPVILAHYVATGAYSGHDWFAEVCRWCGERVNVPVAIHLDHGEDAAVCRMALDLGFTSVMIDGSRLPTDENARLTNEVIAMARPLGVPVEAEIGELLRLDDAGVALKNRNLVDPADVRRFLTLCAPDSLAIGIGNAHGYYSGRPDIHLELLEKVRAFCDLPLVLHGCTGMDDDIIREAIRLGIAKINFGTEIRYKYVAYYREAMDTLDHKGHSWRLSQFAYQKLKEDVRRIIRLAGCEGKGVLA